MSTEPEGCLSGFYNYSPLHLAAFLGHVNIAKILILAKAEINHTDFNGCTPLHLAAINGNIEIVNELINAGAWINAIAGRSTPLHLAVYEGHIDLVNLLLQSGADYSRYCERSGEISVWGKKNEEEISKIITNHRKTENNNYNLFDAASRNDVYKLKKAIENGANVNCYHPSYRRSFKQTPLHFTASVEIAKVLIQANADIDARDYEERTPLHYAVRRGQMLMVKELLQLGADSTLLYKNIAAGNDGKIFDSINVSGSTNNKIAKLIKDHQLVLTKIISDFFIDKQILVSTPLVKIIMEFLRGTMSIVESIKPADTNSCCTIL